MKKNHFASTPIRKIAFTVCLACTCFISVAALAAIAAKATTASTHLAPATAATKLSVRLPGSTLLRIGAEQAGQIELPGVGSVQLVGQGIETLASGNLAWHGYVGSYGSQYRADLVVAANGVIGDIRTPAGRYHLEPTAADSQAATFYGANIPAADLCAPAAMSVVASAAIAKRADAQLASALLREENAQIDVMVVYTPSVSARFGANLPAVIDSVMLAANGATSQSGVKLRFALAGTMMVSPRRMIAGDLTAALRAVSSSEDATLVRNDDFAGMAAKRRALGADIVVTLVSHADYTVGCPVEAPCGVGAAWQATRDSLSSDLPGQHGYAIVDVSASDLSLAVTHEIGHLLGAGHDYASGGDGLFADSKGFRAADGVHGDLMSYAPAATMVFSNPAALCNGSPCGVAAGPAAADNARALNASRFLVAAYQAAAPAPQPDLAGLWTDASDAPQRLHLSHSGNTLTAVWFGYDGGGRPAWYVASGCQLVASHCQADLYTSWTRQAGLLSGAALDTNQIMAAKVGTLDLDAGTLGLLNATMVVNGTRSRLSLTRPTFIAASEDDRTRNGVWWISSGLDSGVSVTASAGSHFLAWFTYGDDGRATWFLAPQCQLVSSGGSCLGELLQFDTRTGATVAVGFAGIEFSSAYAGNFHWQIGPRSGTAAIERELTLP